MTDGLTNFERQVISAVPNILETVFGLKPRPVFREGGGVEAFAFRPHGEGRLMQPESSDGAHIEVHIDMNALQLGPDNDPEAREIFMRHASRMLPPQMGLELREQRNGEIWLTLGGNDGKALLTQAGEIRTHAEALLGKPSTELKRHTTELMHNAGIHSGYGTEMERED